MFQKFNTNTLVGRFIKNLLSKEPLPLLDCVQQGDILLEGRLYILDNHIIRCVETGKLFIDKSEQLFPSETIFPSITLFPNIGYNVARFRVLEEYHPESHKSRFSYNYHSSTHWYDHLTHEHLGNYLRYLRGCKDLDLMPFYNCYSGYEIDDVYLRHRSSKLIHPSNDLYPSVNNDIFPGKLIKGPDYPTYAFGKISETGVHAVPIRFGKTYTIAIDCTSEVQLRSIIYNPHCGMIEIPNTSTQYYSDCLANSYRLFPSLRFDQPFTYLVEASDTTIRGNNISAQKLYSLQKNLYLLIQLPASCSSSIVVLEGDYTHLNCVRTYPAPTIDGPESIRQYTVYKNLSLLQQNTHISYAFSDRLIEYLFGNVINKHEEYPKNITYIQQILIANDLEYRNLYESGKICLGVWDDAILRAIHRQVEEKGAIYHLTDQDGNVNKQLESLFVLGGV